MSPDHRFVDSAGSSVDGRDACRTVWRSFFDSFPDYGNSFDEVVLVTSGVVVATGRSECEFERLCGPARWRAIVDGSVIREWRVEIPGAADR